MPASSADPNPSAFTWKMRHSAWLIATILGVGALSCVGFIYCAVRVKTLPWAVVAVLATAASALGIVLTSTWTNSVGDANDAAVTYIVGLWLVSIILGFVMNPDYLRWRAQH
jgi:hypothetical protein